MNAILRRFIQNATALGFFVALMLVPGLAWAAPEEAGQLQMAPMSDVVEGVNSSDDVKLGKTTLAGSGKNEYSDEQADGQTDEVLEPFEGAHEQELAPLAEEIAKAPVQEERPVEAVASKDETATKSKVDSAQPNAPMAAAASLELPDYNVVQDGVYIIASAKSPSRVLDVCGASSQSGANVLLWDDNGQTNQQWRISLDKKTGRYSIVSVNSGLALAFRSASSGANVYQAKLSATASYLWLIANTSSGYAITPAGTSGVALDIQGGAGNSGDNVELWATNNKPWQRFWFAAVNPKINARNTLSEGVYTIARADSRGQMVDVEGASQGDVANVLLYHSNDGFNQRWYVTRDKDNYYTFTSINSGKSLDICGAGRTPGSNVIQYATHGRANQKWQVRDNGNGTYSIISKLNGLALNAASAKDCANISVFADNGSASERFVFSSIKLVGDGVYAISPRQNLAEVVDVPNVSKSNGVQLALWDYNEGMNQKYQLVDQGNETYTIQVAHSGKYLEDASGKMVQKTKSSGDAQLWKASWRGTGVVLTNKATNRSLTVSGTAKNGAALVTAATSGNASQRFSLTKRDLVEGGLYTMQSGTGARVLDVNGASKADNANVQLWNSNDGNNQKYTISVVSGNYYKIVNLNSGKAVTAAGSGPGANVRQNSYSGSASQLWKAEISPNGGIVFVDKQSGQALSVAGNANANGANVQLAAKSGANGQAWSLVPTRPHDDVLERGRSMANAYGSSTNYFIAVDLANHRTMVFQRSGGSWVESMNVTVSTGASSTPTVTGTFTIGSRGYSFGSGYTCYYWTQFYGDYLFHSVLYDQGTFNVQDGRLGYSISHGCVRMNINDAHWIYDNVPSGTKVRVY